MSKIDTLVNLSQSALLLTFIIAFLLGTLLACFIAFAIALHRISTNLIR